MASAFVNTFHVWHALFLRESLDRFFGSRAAWAWLIFEPCVQFAGLALVYTLMGRQSVGGAPFIEWLLVGCLGFFFFRRTAVQTQHSVDCNKAFFAFRQVKPFDAAIARSSVEAFSMFIIATGIAMAANLVGRNMVPHDPLAIIVVCGGLWLMGFGYGLITAVIMRLIPESKYIFNMLFLPLYFLSGAIFPLEYVPVNYRVYLLYNPIAQALEILREDFFSPYNAQQTSLPYVYFWSLLLVVTGMVMLKIFHKRMMTR